MKEEKECKIVQDLFPNYIENLTSKETNEWIQTHIEECEECKKVWEDLQQEIKWGEEEGIEKKEVDYLKKFSKQVKILKFILIGILLVFTFLVGRKVIILTSLSNKAKQNNSQNFYSKIHSYWNGEMTTIESYRKEENYLLTITSYSEEKGKRIRTYYQWGEEKLHTLETQEGKKVLSEGQASINPVSFSSDNFFVNLYYAIFSRIELINLNGRKCYLVKENHTEKFIDQETGIAIKMIDNDQNRTVDYYYEFGKVTKEDIVKIQKED